MELEKMSRTELIEFARQCFTQAEENNEHAQKAINNAKNLLDLTREMREQNGRLLNRVKALTEENKALRKVIEDIAHTL